MRLSNVWTTVAIVIIAVSAFGLVPAIAHASPSPNSPANASAPSIHPHPAAGVNIFTTDQFGGATSDFYVGESSSQVSFWAYDVAGDGNGTVMIHDLNHTRDGLADPVWTHRIAFNGGGYNYSYDWNIFYQIPLTLSAPGTWNITINGTLGGFASKNFTVHTYYVSTNSGQSSILAGHTGTEEYYVGASINDAPFVGLTSLTALVIYFKHGNWTAITGFPQNLGNGSAGTFTYTVPSNTTGSVQIMVWANVSSGSIKWSEEGFNSQSISTIVAPLVTLTQCPQGCGGGTFTAGATLYLTITTRSSSGGGGVPTPGLHVRISFLRGSAAVTLAGVETNYTSNASGGVALLFPADAPPFGLNVTNYVEVNVTDLLNSVAPAQVVQVAFDLTTASAYPRMQVQLDSTSYFGGETATATWTISAQNGSTAAGWVADYWGAYQVSPYLVISEGPISSTSASGTFPVTVPMGYSGAMEVYFDAHNATASDSAYTEVWVGAAAILLSPSEDYYAPGDTVNVGVSTLNVPSTAQLTYTVVDGSQVIQEAGAVSGGSISVKIPSVNPPSYIYVNVLATDPTAGVITKAYVELSIGGELSILAGVQTKSNYADGSFQPGQSITVTYQISTLGGAPTPKWFYITICSTQGYCGTGSTYLETSATSGTFSYKIPSNTPSGSQDFGLYVESIACGGYSYCYNEATFSIPVNANPSALQYELGAGSGVTVGWLILLIIIIVVALLLFLIGRRRGRSQSPPSTPPAAWSASGTSSSDSTGSGSTPSDNTPTSDPSSSGSSGAPPLPKPSK